MVNTNCEEMWYPYPAAMAEIELRNITKVFSGDVVAIDDVSLRIGDGEFIALVGPSGCGKSTLLRAIAGLEDVTSGEISIGGRDVTDLAPRHRDIAMVFQSYALYPHMSVRQNLGYGLKVRRTPKAEIRKRVDEIAVLLGLDELLERKPAHLSGGQRQRVAMGRAIVRQPQAFLMDEPLSNLDAKLRVGMRASLAQLHQQLGVTTVYVTHDQVEAMTLGQRVAVMKDGHILQVDTPQSLYERPLDLFVAGFIGSPAMNLVEATVDGDHVEFGQLRVPLDPARRPGSLDAGRVILGIRPETFEDASFAPPDLPTLDVDGRRARGARLRRARLLQGRGDARRRRDPRGRGGRRCRPRHGPRLTAERTRRSADDRARRRLDAPHSRSRSLPLLRPRVGGVAPAARCGVADRAHYSACPLNRTSWS